MALKVHLADLRYNYSGVLANDCMPLGVAYMKAVMDRDAPQHESRIFAYPQRLSEAMIQNPPDILMVSNYVWNEALSRYFLRLARQINPNVLTVMGGPNISVEPDRQIAWFEKCPEIDLYILGEADFLATEMVHHYDDAGGDRRKMLARDLPSSIRRLPDGQIVRTEGWERHKEVDEIPSAFLTGIQDEFFDGKLAPMIETNRGCPFSCTYCVQGTRWYTKVHNFSKERLREEIRYIARKIKEMSPNMGTLRIADSNYGMFERDVEISSYIGEVQRDYGWPTFIDATTGKNRPDRIIKSVQEVSGALVLYQAVQSLDENVLRNVKRQTIKLEAYEQLQVHMRGRGLRSTSDLILGLPGESLKTHLAALYRLLDGDIDSLHNFQAMMLKGSEMEGREARDQFKFQTRFRVLPKNFGVENDEIVLDVEEIIVGTDTLSFEDYITARKYHLNSSVFWNDSWFRPVVEFAHAFGIKNSEWWVAMMDVLENGGPVLRGFLDGFVDETKGELFATREECADFYRRPENFERLQRGDIGDNLMYKYRAIASFHIWPEICAGAMKKTREMLLERGVGTAISCFDELWEDFSRYVELKHAHGAKLEDVLEDRTADLRFDIESWMAAKDFSNPEAYRLRTPTQYVFAMTEEGKAEMAAAFKVWSAELKGLTKLVTRINVAWQVRECRAASMDAALVD